MSIIGIGSSGSSYFQGPVMPRIQARGSSEEESAVVEGKKKPYFAQLNSQLDANESGSLESDERQSLAEKISEATGVSVDLSAFLTTYDTDADGVLSTEETVAAQQANPPQGPPPPSGGRLEGADESGMVNAVDSDGDGIIDAQETLSLVDIVNQANGSSLSAEDFMGQYDTDGDDTFTIEEAVAGLEANHPEGLPSPPGSSGFNTAAMDTNATMSALGREERNTEDLSVLLNKSQT